MAKSVGRRGRTRTYDAARTREIILDAAEALFAEHGFHGTSVDAIAVRSGYNKSLLFQYFRDKVGLYGEVLKRADRDMGELVARVFSPGPADETLASDPRQWRQLLRAAFGAMYDHMVERPRLMRIFNWEQADGWRTFSRIASQFEPDDLERFEGVFARAREAGLLRADLDVLVTMVLVAQTCWSAPTALPLYQLLMAGKGVSAPAALQRIRAVVVDMLVASVTPGFDDDRTTEGR